MLKLIPLNLNSPKVIFANAIATADTDILVGELAKILKSNGIEIGQNRLFERLRTDGFLIRRDGSDYNMPTQRAMNLGLFKMKETAITHSDGHVTKNRESYGKRSAVFCELFFIKGNKGENQ